MFRHGSCSFSRHIVRRSEVCAANHRRGDSFGTQYRYEPGPDSLTMYPESPTQKVEMKDKELTL